MRARGARVELRLPRDAAPLLADTFEALGAHAQAAGVAAYTLEEQSLEQAVADLADEFCREEDERVERLHVMSPVRVRALG